MCMLVWYIHLSTFYCFLFLYQTKVFFFFCTRSCLCAAIGGDIVFGGVGSVGCLYSARKKWFSLIGLKEPLKKASFRHPFLNMQV